MADDTTEIAHEADATRERIAATVDDLQHRLSPRTLVNDAVGSLSATGADAMAKLKSRAGAHPLALAAAGLAAGIALLAKSKVSKAKIEYGDSYAAYADYDDSYAQSLDEPGGTSARARIDAIGSKAHGAVDDNPLAVIAVGVATGALLGAIIPVSQTENELFGKARSRLTAAGHAAVDAAREELDAAKFSFEGGFKGIADRAAVSLLNVADKAKVGLSSPNFTAR